MKDDQNPSGVRVNRKKLPLVQFLFFPVGNKTYLVNELPVSKSNKTLLVFLHAFFVSQGQQYFFKNYSVESGLPFVQVSCMCQDVNGYLWTGGYGGLSRFDGKSFLNYNRTHGLPDVNVNAVASDAKGDIFAGTNKGLSILRGKSFINYDTAAGLGSMIVNCLHRDKDIMYVGTDNGLFKYRNGKIVEIPGFPEFKINGIFGDSSELYVATDRGAFYRKQDKIFQVDGLRSERLSAVCGFSGAVYFGGNRGLEKFDPALSVVTQLKLDPAFPNEAVTCLVAQRDSNLWAGTERGMHRFGGGAFEKYNTGGDNNSRKIRCLLIDREENLWLGTHSGLYRYRDNAFTTFDKKDGPGADFIFQIFRDKDRFLWVCTQNNGVYRAEGNNFRRFGVERGLPSEVCRSGLQDVQGRLMFGTAENLVQFINGKFNIVPTPRTFKGPVDMLFQGRDSTLWMGGVSGICSLKWKGGKPYTAFYPIESRMSYNVYGFCEDSAGDLYVGTYKAGLHRFRNGKLENLSRDWNLGEETFFTIRYKQGKILAASLNGLLILDIATKKITRITDADGLNSLLVYSIEFSRDGRGVWIGTNQGINWFNLKKYLASGLKEITSYGKEEGFSGVECNGNGIWEDKDGTLWFGTVNGLIKYQPFNFRRNMVESRTVIQDVLAKDELLAQQQRYTLAADQNNLTIYFRGICFTDPGKVRYMHKLEGLKGEKDWSEARDEDYIRYINLAPGKYVFRVKSCNNEGVWNSEPASIHFSIRTPFYLRWWFILSMALLAFAIVLTVFRIRIHFIKKKQKALYERRVEMSKIELKALRAQMNPHFIFNSLNAIQHYIFNAKGDEAAKYLNKFARLVRIILNNSEKSTVTVGEDLESLKLYLELEQMRFEGKFDYEISIAPEVDLDYDVMPPLLMQPYVENAILHGLNPRPDKGRLTIEISSKNNFLICTIIDNGIGRRRASEIRKTMPYRDYKSFGMKITEERLRILNEIGNSSLSVTIEDIEGFNGTDSGTKVYLYVPLIG